MESGFNIFGAGTEKAGLSILSLVLGTKLF